MCVDLIGVDFFFHGWAGDWECSRTAEVWRESDCEKLNYMANMLMEGLVMQALGGPLSKMRGREAWLLDFLTALRSERKGFWHTDVRRVSQMLRSLETNLPWRTMSQIFRDERVPLLKSIKVSQTNLGLA